MPPAANTPKRQPLSLHERRKVKQWTKPLTESEARALFAHADTIQTLGLAPELEVTATEVALYAARRTS